MVIKHSLARSLERVIADRGKEIERLQAIVDKLPKTADGVPVVPGMEVYPRLIMTPRDPTKCRVECVYRSMSIDVQAYWGGPIVNYDPEECYSTREAAEATSREGK